MLRQSDVIRLMLKHTKVKKSIQIEEEYAQKKRENMAKTDIFPLIFLLFLLFNSEFFAIFGLIYEDCVAWSDGFVEEQFADSVLYVGLDGTL